MNSNTKINSAKTTLCDEKFFKKYKIMYKNETSLISIIRYIFKGNHKFIKYVK